MKLLIYFLAFLAALAGQDKSSEVEYPKKPWELEFTVLTEPTLYRKGDDYYWYMVYEVKNPSDFKVTNIVDVSLYLVTGRDYLSDRGKMDVETYIKLYDNPDMLSRPYESQGFGTLYQSVYSPEVEVELVARDAGINNRNHQIIVETIEKFRSEEKNGFRCFVHKSFFSEQDGVCDICERPLERIFIKGLYLNPRNLREVKYIEPGQTLHCISIFHVDGVSSQILDVQIAGLRPVTEIKGIKRTGVVVEKKDKVLHLLYEFEGDPVNRVGDMAYFVDRRWDTKRVGPVTTKQDLSRLMNKLVDAYKLERKWESEKLSKEERERRRNEEGITDIDIKLIITVFQLATGMDFGFDLDNFSETGGLLGNNSSFYSLQEWWIKNRSSLKYDPQQNIYVPEERE